MPSSCRVPSFTPAPSDMANGEICSVKLPGVLLSFTSTVYQAPLLPPKRSVSQLFTWVSSAAKICGEKDSVMSPLAKPKPKMSDSCSILFCANVRPSTNRSFEPTVQLPAAPICQPLRVLSVAPGPGAGKFVDRL